MSASIVYIHHDCFLLRAGGKTLLFDYPAPSYLPREAAQVAAAHIAGADLTVFVSHSHDDHFDPDIVAATQAAATRHFVVSDDVADLYGDRLPPERSLAALFGVSRNSMREAIKSLEQAGLLESRPGAGTFISAASQAELARQLGEAFARERHRLEDIFELRLL